MAQNVGIGIVGIGFMGWTHYQAIGRLDGARVTAISSRDPKKRAGDWTGIQGNFGPPGTVVDVADVGCYEEYADLLDDPGVDLVDLCVPNDRHAEMAIQAMAAGKHVLVEKPIALDLRDADVMVAAAHRHERLLMVGHVLPFFPEFAFARAAIASGQYGKLRAAHLTRVIARPDWSTGIADADRSGGPVIDLHIHDAHYVALVCGVPLAVHARGVIDPTGAVTYLTSQYLFDDPGLAVSCASGALSQAGRPFAHGFEFYLDDATLAFEFANLGGQGTLVKPLTIIRPDGTVERPDLPGSGDPVDAFVAEICAAVAAVRSGLPDPVLDGALARQALRICRAEERSVRSGGVISLLGPDSA